MEEWNWCYELKENKVTGCEFGNEALYNGKDRESDMDIFQSFSNKTKYSPLVIPAVLRLFLIIDTGTSS
jgi:hypothetical protein